MHISLAASSKGSTQATLTKAPSVSQIQAHGQVPSLSYKEVGRFCVRLVDTVQRPSLFSTFTDVNHHITLFFTLRTDYYTCYSFILRCNVSVIITSLLILETIYYLACFTW